MRMKNLSYSIRLKTGWSEFYFISLTILFCYSAIDLYGQTTDPGEILKSINLPEKDGYGSEMYAKMTDYKGEKKDITLSKVRRKEDSAYLEFLKPSGKRGDKILMTGGRLWYLKKGSGNPLPITPRMQLFGQASVGDILMIKYSEEYDPVSVSHAEYNGKKVYILDLVRKKDKNPPYDRILYTVLEKERTGVYAEYYTLSGKMVKKAVFESLYIDKYKLYFFNKVTIYDGLNKSNRTEIEYSEPEVRIMPFSEFDRNLLFK
jgi:hypothetical protein